MIYDGHIFFGFYKKLPNFFYDIYTNTGGRKWYIKGARGMNGAVQIDLSDNICHDDRTLGIGPTSLLEIEKKMGIKETAKKDKRT